MNSLIDSHCHIDFPDFDIDRHSLLSECRSRGMSAILVPGVSANQWQQMANVVRDYSDDRVYPRLLPAYGMHPCFMSQHDSVDLNTLELRLSEGALAVGEIGLDAFHGDELIEAQLTLFKAQLSIAKGNALPVVIHSRKTQDLVLKCVRQLQFKEGGILHAFSGSLQQAQLAVDLGFKIGFGGAATYERANRIKRILKTLPREAVVFETDSPDIPPSFDRGNRNTPLNLFRIVEILAQVRDEPIDELLASSTQNVLEILKLAD